MNRAKNENLVVRNATLDDIILEKTSTPLVVVLCPNYEDRSRAILAYINCINKANRPIRFLIICLKNQKNNDLILENLKTTNINIISEKFHIPDDSIHWIDYPNEFSSNALKSILAKSLKKLIINYQPLDVLCDISTMPKSIIFNLCVHIYTLKKSIRKIYFSYAQPKEYSSVHYAQDVGIIKGMFSGNPIQFDNNQHLHTIIFPSRTGHEGKLLCDSLDSLNQHSLYRIYFPIHATEFNSSLEIMRANQSLLDSEAYNVCFYSSLQDAIKEFDDYFKNEATNLYRIIKQAAVEQGKPMFQTYLVAPFGPKVFVPLAYFELLNLKKIAPELVSIEICHIKGFQYTSVYSIGIGNITSFELEVKS